ncbi:MAG: S8 family serine peptidase [Candidatus Sungbacteria bacterium]|nr:S8 family serine peptidase [Candidatus Sungbacteria bacterium]
MINFQRKIHILILFVCVVAAFALSHQTVFAQAVLPFDLLNLKAQEPSLVIPYDIIKVTEAWDRIKNSMQPLSQVILGVVDTDFQINHPEFEGVDIGRSPISTEVMNEAHGTAVMGIIGANNISRSGSYIFPQMNGILSGATTNYILGFRKISSFRRDELGSALNGLVDGGVEIINMSLGLVLETALTPEQKANPFLATKAINQERFTEYEKFFNDYFSKRTDILFTVAAGNQNVDVVNHTPGGQANKQNTIAVGATTIVDGRTEGIFGSNFGSGVALAAPGEKVYAPTGFVTPLGLDDYWNPSGRSGRFFGGTSASAPMVTGVAGLIKAIKPNLTPAQIKQILTESADPIFSPIGSDEAEKLLGSGCTAISTPAGQTQRGCRLNAEKAVCHALVGLGCVVSPPSPPGVWTSVGTMTTKRLEHSMTVLPNGKVLIAGGQTENGFASGATTSAELFDPATNTFTRTGTMFLPRRAHTATLLPNGKVLMAGGWDGIDPASYIATELYDPASGTFSFIGNMTHTRHWHTATLLQDGTVLLIGGEGNINETLASAELFNSNTNTFSSVGSMSTVRRFHAAMLLRDGRVLVSGGNGAGGVGFPNLLNAEIYNPLTQTFEAPIQLVAARLRHTATLLPDASVFLAGGLAFSFTPTAERFKPVISQFEAVSGEMLTNRNSHTALSLSDGRVFIIGGKTPPGIPIPDVELYDSGQDAFQLTGNMHISRTSFPGNASFAVMLADGRIFAAGGAADIDFTNAFITITDTAEVFMPD